MKNQIDNLIINQEIKYKNESKEIFMKVKNEFHFAKKKGE
jgi:hypothetical protein